MNVRFPYLFRKYPFVRFLTFGGIAAIVFITMLFFSFSTLHTNTITSIHPQIAHPHEYITVIGSRFGNKLPHSWLVVGKHRLPPEKCLEWTDTKIVFKAPDDLYEDIVYVITKNKQGNAVFVVNRQALPVRRHNIMDESLPLISDTKTITASVGEIITIHGKNFGQVRNKASVIFTHGVTPVIFQTEKRFAAFDNAAECSDADFDFYSWSDTKIRIRVPDGADSGSIIIKTDKGISNPLTFKLKKRFGVKKYTETRTYHLVAEVDITNIHAQNPNTFFLRIPVPYRTAAQPTVSINTITPKPFITNYQGATLHRFSNISDTRNIRVKQEYTLTCSKIETEINPAAYKNSKKIKNTALYNAYTKHTALLPAGNKTVKALCKHIVKNEWNAYLKAKKIFSYIMNQFTIEKTVQHGSKNSVIEVLEEKKGNAYDMTLLFCTMARAAGIPALPSAGILITAEKRSMLHWWAEFYLDGIGWIPVDTAMAQGIPFDSGVFDKKTWYFGNLDAYRIVFSRGIKVQLPMLANGKTNRYAQSFAFMSIWEEASENITGYSPLWRIPRVTAVY